MGSVGRILLIVLIVLLAGCGGASPSTTAGTMTETPTRTTGPAPTATPTETPTSDISTQSIDANCSDVPGDVTASFLAPSGTRLTGWSLSDRAAKLGPGPGDEVSATYRRADGLKVYVEINKFETVQAAVEQSHKYENITRFQVSLQHGRFTWALQTYRENASALTIVSDGAQEASFQLLSSVSTGTYGLSSDCLAKLAVVTPPDSPHVTVLSTPTTTETPSSPDENAYQVTIIEVVDGDTMDIRYQNGSMDTIRLLGVDTPEVHVKTDPSEFEGVPSNEAGRNWLRDWGHKASEFARTEVLGDEVRIVVDARADHRGSYGRLLVYLVEDGKSLNLALIKQGYARMYDSSFSKRVQYRTVEEAAQNNDVGLWGFESKATSTPTGNGDRETLNVALIHEDAEGNDHENENNEYVSFENTGDAPIDLSGWVVRDEAGHTYRFPDGFTLEAGDTVTLYTGRGSNSDSSLYWGSDSAIWNNGGDTIFVENSDGELVLQESY